MLKLKKNVYPILHYDFILYLLNNIKTKNAFGLTLMRVLNDKI